MMKQKRTILLTLCMMFVFAFVSPVVTFANSLDDISNGSNENGSSSSSSDSDDSSGAVSDYLKDYTPITNENMEKASTLASPIANFLGTLAGGILIVVEAAIVVVTALDLAYIGLPFTRSILNPSYAAGGAGMAGGMGMGGFGGGYGRMGGMGSMGGGMQAGTQQTGLHRQWVSDEAVKAVMNAQPQQQVGGGMGGMGGMGGGFGGMGMGGGMQPQQAPQNTKSVIATYFKRSIFFIVIFTVAAIVLTSSILTDSGINLAQLLMKLIGKGNTMVGIVQIQ